MSASGRFEGAYIGPAVNRDAIDQFTALHVLSGFVLYFLLKAAGWNNGWLVLGLAIAWEIFEPMAKEFAPDVFPNPTPDSTINKTWDVIAVMVGWLIAGWISNE
jgi:hypothetical protein